jgi:hypothetical protein
MEDALATDAPSGALNPPSTRRRRNLSAHGFVVGAPEKSDAGVRRRSGGEQGGQDDQDNTH